MSTIRARKVTVTLPPEMADKLDRVRRAEHRTRSDVVRAAIQSYREPLRDDATPEEVEEWVRLRTAELPVEEATPEELAAIEEGRAAIRRGDYVTYEELHAELEADRIGGRAERSQKTSAPGKGSPRQSNRGTRR